MTSRARTISSLTRDTLDLLIIGGGIVGAGIARDAAMRGLRVGLVEQHDFAFGTSGRSSRLLHGGIRYLAQGRLGLVRQASREKKILHQIAPHLAQPLAFTFPAYKSNPHWRLWRLKLGVKVYDLLCGGKNFGPSTWLNPRGLAGLAPYLNPSGLKGAVRYYDGFTNDARLTLDTLRSAARHGASIVNYCRFKSAHQSGAAPNAFGAASSCPWVCTLDDLFADRILEARAHAIVNATGPWADGLPHSRIKLRLTKGIHIVLARERLLEVGPLSNQRPPSLPRTEIPIHRDRRGGEGRPALHSLVEGGGEGATSVARKIAGSRGSTDLPTAFVMAEGKRILFAIPWGERVILGTTDTDYTGPLDDVHADSMDIQYVLRVTNDFFPAAKLTGSDIISTWAGLRPLLADRHGNPSDISRAHQIRSPEPGWWDVAGGKLTTYRLIAQQTVDQVLKWLKRESGSPWADERARSFGLCRTAQEALLPADETVGVSAVLPPDCQKSVVEHYVTREWALHLDDVMLRRTGWHYYFPERAIMSERVADWMAELLGWSAETRCTELERYGRLRRLT
jgi:glycerol-3-phosphate dehydrogenase